ncbi:MAG: hypothetical protein HY536_00010 [Candidatus Colwellbacteria bacterium]|nr:hypothetical protein [Candidatus Colwellbacteria bacterium]
MKLHLCALALVALAGLLQNTSLVTVAGVKPNLVLAVFAALAFAPLGMVWFLTLVALGALLVYFPGAASELAVLAALIVLMFALAPRIPAKAAVAVPLAAALATLAFYLIIDVSLVTDRLDALLIELVYNATVALAASGLVTRVVVHEAPFRDPLRRSRL